MAVRPDAAGALGRHCVRDLCRVLRGSHLSRIYDDGIETHGAPGVVGHGAFIIVIRLLPRHPARPLHSGVLRYCNDMGGHIPEDSRPLGYHLHSCDLGRDGTIGSVRLRRAMKQIAKA